jgi:RecB family exonuclease
VLDDTFTLSPSQADSYVRCPRRYVLERRLRLGDSASPYAEFGSLVHKTLEAAEKEILGTGKAHADLSDALDHLRAVWAEADFGTPELTAAWLEQAEVAITKLYENWPTEDGIPIGLEEKVKAIINGVTWRGKVDRIERTAGGLRIVDYKTSKSAARINDAKTSIQLGFYAMAIEGSSGEPVVGAEMWFPRHRTQKLTTRRFDLECLDEVEAEMTSVTSAIRDEDWSPVVGEGCRRCVFRLSCPAWPEGRGAYLP